MKGAVLFMAAALALAATAAQAQTPRAQTGPGDSAATRRILAPALGLTTFGPPPDHYVPLAGDALTRQYVEDVAPAMVPPPATVAARTLTTVGVWGRAPLRAVRRDMRTASARIGAPPRRAEAVAVAAPVSDQPLALGPAQRQLIYRAVAQVYRPPLLADPFYVQSNYPLHAIYPADNSYGTYAFANDVDRMSTRAYGYQADVLDPYHTAYRWNGIPLVVGARIPASVPLAALPEWLAARVPAARPYSYAVLDNRVLLVDPSTGIIVAAIAP
jgi:hypothetical protein